jgi:hypothetical protein
MAIPIPGDVRQLLDAPNYVHLSTLRADGSPRARSRRPVVVSVYSSGAIGRLVPHDVIGLVRYLREHAPAGQ